MEEKAGNILRFQENQIFTQTFEHPTRTAWSAGLLLFYSTNKPLLQLGIDNHPVWKPLFARKKRKHSKKSKKSIVHQLQLDFCTKKERQSEHKKILKKYILHHQLKFDFRTGAQESVIWDYQSCRNVWKILKLGENPNHILLPPKYML